MNTHTLVKACLKGNEQAQKQLYDAFAGQMMGVCYRFTKSTEDAEDVLQEGFIKVFTNLAQYKGDGELAAWIRKIMVNTALAYLKKNKHYSNELLIKEDHMHVVSDDHPEINVHVKELIEMIRQLPVGYQTIFNMHAIEGYSHMEIGQLLGVSESTSRSQYMRARNQLITWLQKQPGEFKKTSYA
ncbi:RNA polymerase sigma factor [Ilyomonas limi]|uniref:RNA polymerase sigma factor n=1 Tax=Ilyomonas limi TaxID=2575867 RepID=A0A4U3L1G8_9BACT|nr:RNA polymerase sigma factor [Ilyomonas limi]TKK68825.1 RNA polymerase sigma factor [Ilyomonas limi]